MGMSTGSGPGGDRAPLAEINVTPLVDVMLVLLIIFMVAAGVQTVEMEAERQDILEEAEDLVEQARKLQDKADKDNTKVDLDLPKVDSDKVNLTETRRLQLVATKDLVFSIDGTVLVDCPKVSPGMKKYLGAAKAGTGGDAEYDAFEPCLKALGGKLVDNYKLQQDKELYLLADRGIDYGKVLRIMAAVRQAGVTKFGLVAEPGVLGDAGVERTPDELQ